MSAAIHRLSPTAHLAGLAALLALGLAGCDSGSDETASGAGGTMPAETEAADAPATDAGSDVALTIVSWGGAYTASQIKAFHEPFEAQTGIEIQSVDYDGNAAPIKAQVQSGNVTWDVVDVELPVAIRLCDEGALEEIDATTLADAPDGTPATEDFLEGTLYDCAVGNDVWSTVYAYNEDSIDGDVPTDIGDFFDTEAFTGRRGMRKTPKGNLEMALMADGVPAAEVYDVLATEEGVDRAFAKLDTIKNDVVWWEAGAQPPQLLADGEVVMTTAYNGRIFNAIYAEDQPFEIVWDGQVWDIDLWVIPRGSPVKEEAMQFIRFATQTEPMAEQFRLIAYGPTRASAQPLVTTHLEHGIDMQPHLPTYPANMENALQTDPLFWADYGVELEQRFNAWLAS